MRITAPCRPARGPRPSRQFPTTLIRTTCDGSLSRSRPAGSAGGSREGPAFPDPPRRAAPGRGRPAEGRGAGRFSRPYRRSIRNGPVRARTCLRGGSERAARRADRQIPPGNCPDGNSLERACGRPPRADGRRQCPTRQSGQHPAGRPGHAKAGWGGYRRHVTQCAVWRQPAYPRPGNKQCCRQRG